MTSDDDKISRRYRELARDEPPRQVDEAILAAARRAVDARPAPHVAPTGRRRWYFPLAAAAIIVLAVAVTVHVERQSPDLEMVEAPLRQEPAPAAQAPAEPPREFTPDPKREAPQKLRAQREAEVLADSEKRQVAPAAPAASPPETSTSEARDSVRADAAARPQARAETQSGTWRPCPRFTGTMAAGHRRPAQPGTSRRGGQGARRVQASISRLPRLRGDAGESREKTVAGSAQPASSLQRCSRRSSAEGGGTGSGRPFDFARTLSWEFLCTRAAAITIVSSSNAFSPSDRHPQ
jgi:hypothetical protein